MLGHVCDDGPKVAKSRVVGRSKQQTVVRQQVEGTGQQPVGVVSGQCANGQQVVVQQVQQVAVQAAIGIVGQSVGGEQPRHQVTDQALNVVSPLSETCVDDREWIHVSNSRRPQVQVVCCEGSRDSGVGSSIDVGVGIPINPILKE